MTVIESRQQKLGRLIRTQREALIASHGQEFTQQRIADRLGIAQTTLSAIENGKREQPRLRTLAALTFDLRLDLDAILIESGWPDVSEYLAELHAAQEAVSDISAKDREILQESQGLLDREKDTLIDLARFLRSQRGALLVAAV